MAGLLVSVRSADEARTAIQGGASIIDVKEPRRGPLGRADEAVWREVVAVVGARAPVSVALGELTELERDGGPVETSGVCWRKLGLARVGDDESWRARWAAVRAAPGPGWIAVAYVDAERARAPAAAAVVEEAIEAGCAGVLFDTWDKAARSPMTPSGRWLGMVERLRAAGLLVAVAGGLDLEAIGRLAPLRPDFFAVRGAACAGGKRGGAVHLDRVRGLRAAAERA